MTRYKLTIEYNGVPYAGWQVQPNLPTVQGTLTSAIQNLFKNQKDPLPSEFTVHGSGRTDAGVHALKQVAHVDLPERDPFKLCQSMNHYLKGTSIAVLNVQKRSNQFHARFSAVQRHYIYKILNRRSPSPLLTDRHWHIGVPLDLSLMKEATYYLCGQQDFTSFRSAHCQAKNPIRTLDQLDIVLDQDQIIFHLKAKSFLHNQVRALVGTLVLVGQKRIRPEEIKKILDARDRRCAGPNAVPYGLYLTNVLYPKYKDIELTNV